MGECVQNNQKLVRGERGALARDGKDWRKLDRPISGCEFQCWPVLTRFFSSFAREAGTLTRAQLTVNLELERTRGIRLFN